MERDADLLMRLEDLMRREFFSNHCNDGGGIPEAPAPEPAKPEYQYSPLPNAAAIRLLRLEPGAPGSPLYGVVQYTSLDAVSTYEALSYAWGSQAKPHQLNLNSGSLPITDSLHSALLRLRKTLESRVLWIDAVCINQSDNAEKSRQVQLMTRIFASASRVLCFLGEDSLNSDGKTALHLIRLIGRANFSSLTVKAVTASFMKDQGFPDVDDPQWHSMLWFWSLPWFRRAWVVQEFILASEVEVICGESDLDWRELVSGAEKLLEYGLLDWGTMKDFAASDLQMDTKREYANAGALSLRMMMEIRSTVSWGDLISNVVRSFSERDQTGLRELEEGGWGTTLGVKTLVQTLRSLPSDIADDARAAIAPMIQNVMSLLGESPRSNVKLRLTHLLLVFAQTCATDPRDKLYALLGLSEEGSDLALRPDYSEPTESVYTRFARRFISDEDDRVARGILANAGTAARLPSSTLNLPSWVPDWSASGFSPTRILSSGAELNFCFHAAGDTRPLQLPTEDAMQFKTKGFFVDDIRRIIRSPKFSAEPSVGDIQNFFKDCDDTIANRQFSYPFSTPKETRVAVQWRTLIGNIGTRPMIPEAPYGDMYLDFRRRLEQSPTIREQSIIPTSLDGMTNEWFNRWVAVIEVYDLCEMSNGLVGLVPKGCTTEDKVIILHGGNMPFVIRSKDHKYGKYELVGCCYVHGIMQGEFIARKGQEDCEITLF